MEKVLFNSNAKFTEDKKAILINSGISKHGYYYSDDLLKQHSDKFNGVPLFFDHEGDRGLKNISGVFRNCEYSEQHNGIVANLSFLEHKKEDEEIINNLMKSGLDVGLSAVFYADYEIKNNVANVNKIHSVESVDFVINPATEGKFLNQNRSNEMNEELTVEEIVNAHTENTTVQVNNEVVYENNEVDTNKNEGVITNNINQTPVNYELLNRLMTERLVQNNNMPQESVEFIMNELDNNQIQSPENIQSVIDKYNKFMNSVGKRVVSNPTVRPTEDETDRIINSIRGFFVGADVNNVPRIDSVRKLWKLTTGDDEVTGLMQNCNPHKLGYFINATNKIPNAKIVNGINLSSWTVAFGNLMYREMLNFYQGDIDLQKWRKLVRVGKANDFRPMYRLRYGGYGDFPVVNEAENYPALTSPAEESVNYQIRKRGGTENLTWESIVNDDVNAVAEIPRRMAYAASRTLYKFVMDFLISNGTIYDGLALFHASHPASGTTQSNTANVSGIVNAFSYKHVAQAYNAMRSFLDVSNGERLGIQPKYIVASIDYEQILWAMLGQDKQVSQLGATSGTGDSFSRTNNFASDDNYVKSLSLEAIINPLTTSTSVFYVADPARCPTIEVAFYGSELPEMFVQDMPNMGTMFANDTIVYKLRHVYGGAVMDWRGFYRHVNS